MVFGASQVLCFVACFGVGGASIIEWEGEGPSFILNGDIQKQSFVIETNISEPSELSPFASAEGVLTLDFDTYSETPSEPGDLMFTVDKCDGTLVVEQDYGRYIEVPVLVSDLLDSCDGDDSCTWKRCVHVETTSSSTHEFLWSADVFVDFERGEEQEVSFTIEPLGGE